MKSKLTIICFVWNIEVFIINYLSVDIFFIHVPL